MQAAAKKQDEIDERIDQGGPSTPVGGPATEPDPAPEPSEPKPTEPEPEADREPKPKPKPTAEPKPKPSPADPPPASGGKVDRAIAFARAQLGEPYKWGGAGPGSWDCSGLVDEGAGAAAGREPAALGERAVLPDAEGVRSAASSVATWSSGATAARSSIYHVAMYLGGGKMIHAPRPGRSVEIVSITYWIKPDLASRPG